MKINIDMNLPSNEHFPKSINTKPKNDQGKSYSDRTNRKKDKQKDKQKDIENYNIDNMVCIGFLIKIPLYR